MEKPVPPRFDDFGLTEERYHAVKRSMIGAWASQPDCPTCRKVRQGLEYLIRSFSDADYRARSHYDEAYGEYESRLDEYYAWLDKRERVEGG